MTETEELFVIVESQSSHTVQDVTKLRKTYDVNIQSLQWNIRMTILLIVEMVCQFSFRIWNFPFVASVMLRFMLLKKY